MIRFKPIRATRVLHDCNYCKRTIPVGAPCWSVVVADRDVAGGFYHVYECAECAERNGRPIPPGEEVAS